MEFWSRYKTAELIDFQEKGRLPDVCWLEKWGKPISTPAIRDVWRATLEQTLPAAVKDSEKPSQADPDRDPTVARRQLARPGCKRRRPRTSIPSPSGSTTGSCTSTTHGSTPGWRRSRTRASCSTSPARPGTASPPGPTAINWSSPPRRTSSSNSSSGSPTGPRPREALLQDRKGQEDDSQRTQDVPQGDGVQAGTVPVRKKAAIAIVVPGVNTYPRRNGQLP